MKKNYLARSTPGVKPGVATSEWVSHVVVTVVSLLAAMHVIPNGLPDRYSVIVQAVFGVVAALTTLVYVRSRGRVKSAALFALNAADETETAFDAYNAAHSASFAGQLSGSNHATAPPFSQRSDASPPEAAPEHRWPV